MVVEKSGKEIEFQLCENLYVDSLVRMARANMPCHILMIKADQSIFLNETIAHECGHVLRLLSVAPIERKVSCSTSLHVSTAKAELELESSCLPPNIKKHMFDTWINGLVLQVNNLPVDVRIERWIYGSYVGLREEQAGYLRNQALACVSTFSKEIEEITPKKVFRSNRAMVYAYLKAIGQLIGEDFTHHFDSHHEIIDMGEVLYDFLPTPDRGYLQDIEITNEWANILGLSGWFEWIDFENVPQEWGSKLQSFKTT